MNGIRLKAADTAYSSGCSGGGGNIRFVYNEDVLISMFLMYHVGIALAPETPMFAYRKFFVSHAHTSQQMFFFFKE